MFERLKRKPKVQVIKPDVKLNVIVPQELIDFWMPQGYSAKADIEAYLKTLNRAELLIFDVSQFEKTDIEDATFEAYSDVEWETDWPLGKESYRERIPEIVKDHLPIKYHTPKDKNGRDILLDLNQLVLQINGIQTKLDKVETLISNAEFKLCGKDALKL